MEGIESLLAEVERQPAALSTLARSKVRRAARGSLFVGAGDSYAAAMAGFFASGGRCIAMDPYTLASAPEIAAGLEVYFISVSGRTASNVAAAGKLRGVAAKTTAITAVEDSPLARRVDRVNPLPMTYAPRRAGMMSFSLSLLAVLKLVGRNDESDFRRALRQAKKDARSLAFGGGTTYFLGNSAGYAAALYASAKAYEVLGVKAHAELLEEFSHLEMFSLTKGDHVDAFSCFDPSGMAGKLAAALARSGYSSSAIPSRGKTFVERLFHSVFVGQLSVLQAASMEGLREPRFLSSGGRLQASDSMIY